MAIINDILKEGDAINIMREGGINRQGKVYGQNVLYTYFIQSEYEILMHFDADHVLSENAVSGLAKAILSGLNISTCLNMPIRGVKIFQRVLYVMSLPPTIQRQNGSVKFPLVGHNGAYDRNAVVKIGQIPIGGMNEELYVLLKVLENGLSYAITTDALSYYALPATLSDYIMSTRRVYGRVKSFEHNANQEMPSDFKILTNEVRKVVYANPPIKIIIKSILSDLIASFFVPYIFLVRWAVMRTSKIYQSDVWDSVRSTKSLTR